MMMSFLENGWLCPAQTHTFLTIIALSAKISQIKRRRIGENAGEAACVKIDKAKVDFCADFEYDIGTKVWWYQW